MRAVLRFIAFFVRLLYHNADIDTSQRQFTNNLVSVFLEKGTHMEQEHRQTRESLKEEIVHVFSDVELPTVPTSVPDLRMHSQARWQDTPITAIEASFDKLPLLTPEELHFYLPAYLCYALDTWADSLVWEFTVYALSPGKVKSGDMEWWRDRFRRFTPQQMQTLIRFLNLVLSDPNQYSIHTSVERGKKRLMQYTGLTQEEQG
jgi:hypothetical protein